MTLVQFLTEKPFWYELHWIFIFFGVPNWQKFSPNKLWFPCLMSMSRLCLQDVNNYLYMDLKHKLQSKLQKNLLASLLTSLNFMYLKSLLRSKVDFHLAQKLDFQSLKSTLKQIYIMVHSHLMLSQC
jgi:hypothetical protein